jgi:hypothetical protein
MHIIYVLLLLTAWIHVCLKADITIRFFIGTTWSRGTTNTRDNFQCVESASNTIAYAAGNPSSSANLIYSANPNPNPKENIFYFTVNGVTISNLNRILTSNSNSSVRVGSRVKIRLCSSSRITSLYASLICMISIRITTMDSNNSNILSEFCIQQLRYLDF